METVKAGPSLAVGLALTDLDVQDLWGRYVALGGVHSRLELALYISGETAWTPEQHDIAATALNEFTSDRGMDHPVRYARDVEPHAETQ
jgi:hypothetical protein